MIVALVPAHNESAGIEDAVVALFKQTTPPDRVIVIADNCTDNTAEIAQSAGAEVFITVNNSHRKAGALNQAIDYVQKYNPELLLIQDADTVIVDTWIETALKEIAAGASAVGAVFKADSDKGWLRGCQAREWFRYAEEIERTGRTFVLSGTASLIDFNMFKHVRYDENSITEDFRATIDLLHAGAVLKSPVECTSITETMPTLADLFRQRRRWSLGALQTIFRVGLTKHTAIYWWQQFMLGVSVLCMTMFLSLTVILALGGYLGLTMMGIGLTVIFITERVVTVWGMGRRHVTTAALLIPELIYAITLQIAHVAAIYQFITRSKGVWHHV